MRKKVLAVGICFIVVGVVGAAMAKAGNRVVGDCRHSQSKPAQVIVYCADANGLFEHLRWSSFGGSTARATGDYSVNDCSPSCAAGHFRTYPVSVTFSHATRCPDGKHDYQVALAVYTSQPNRPSGSPGGAGKPGKLSLPCTPTR
jgi:hypothetical protein